MLRKLVIVFGIILTVFLYAEYNQATLNYGVLTSGGTEQAVGSGTGIYFKNPALIGFFAQGDIQNAGGFQKTANFYAAAFNITIDNVAPIANSVSIKSGTTYSNARNVSLQVSATDADGLLDKMRISNDSSNWTTVNYSSYYSSRELSSGDGEKIVYVQVSDLMGNWSDTISDSIVLDTTAPNPPSGMDFNVAGGLLSSGANTLTKTAGSVDSGDALQWRFRTNASDWTAYSTVVAVSGNNADGLTEYAIQGRSMDLAGNYAESEIVTKSSIDRTMTGVPGVAAAIPWSTEPDPAKIDFADSTAGDADQNNYKIYWGKSATGTEANAGSGVISEYDPPSITGGPGAYYLRASVADNTGNFGPWITVAVYQYYLAADQKEYFFVDDNNVSQNIELTANARWTRVDLSNDNSVIGYVSVNAEDLGLSLDENEFTKIIIDKDSNGNPFVLVPENSALAITVNAAKVAGTPAWVPISFSGFKTAPIIYVSTENGSLAITGYNGATIANAESDRIRNYYFNPLTGYVTFEVNEFSQYGTAVINNISFDNFVYYGDPSSTVSARVRIIDENNDGVAAAPVTFSILSGDGTMQSDVSVTTDVSGYANVIFQFPADNGSTTLKAETTGNISNTAVMTMTGGLSAEELEQYEIWAAQYTPDIGGTGNDPDGDGVINLYEWNFGEAPTTDPTDEDTDNDGADDKWDAYPKDASYQVFDSVLATDEVEGKTFAGTAKGQVIYALAGDMYVQYNELSETEYISKNITSGGVVKISGLAYERIKDGNLGEAYSDDIYRGLEPGREYSVLLSYINRGNDTDSYTATVTLEQEAARWSSTAYVNNLNNISRWQLASFEAKAVPSQANAYELVTLNVSIALSSGSAIEYEAFSGAWTGGTFNNDGWYGGKQQFPASGSHEFILQAEGYAINFLSKTAVINVPSGAQASNQGKLIPGSQIIFTIVMKNISTAVASSVNVTDVIPQNCHLYYTNTPNVTGATDWEWKGVTSNTAGPQTADAVKYEITIPSRGTITVNYTVTVD
jgi:uncharacterized repeat protein (TIGR01451 family)